MYLTGWGKSDYGLFVLLWLHHKGESTKGDISSSAISIKKPLVMYDSWNKGR